MIQRDCAARKLNAAFTGDKRADGPGLRALVGRVDQEPFAAAGQHVAVAGQQVDLRKGPRRTDAFLVTDKMAVRIGELGRRRAVRKSTGLLNLLNHIGGTAEVETGEITTSRIETFAFDK